MLEKNNQSSVRLRYCLAVMAVTVTLFAGGCSSEMTKVPQTGSIQAYTTEQSELESNRHTMPEGQKTSLPVLSTDNYEVVSENDRFTLYYREEEATIRLLDKSNGYVWACLGEEHPDDLNKKWTAYANSIVAVEYSNEEEKVSILGVSEKHLSVTRKSDGMEFLVDLGSLDISFAFRLTLTEKGLTLDMKDSSIKEDGENRLVSVTFLPYFGSVRGNEMPGYLFVPDGCGALIRFREPRSYLNGFAKRVYGVDYGVDSLSVINDLGSERVNAFATDEKSVSVPVFGMAHGTEQNAYLSIMEKGAEYAEIQADPAGIVTNYNRVHATFIYRSIYEQPVNKKGSGVQSVQKSRNPVNPQISYYFLSGDEADYVGMAKYYGSYLKNQRLLTPMRKEQEGIPMSIDFLVADVQKEFIGSSVNRITEASEIENFAKGLGEHEITGYQISLLGWQKEGLNGYSLTGDSEKSVFSEDDFERIEHLIAADGGSLSLGISLFSGSKLQLNTKKEASITMSQEMAVILSQNESQYLGDRYLVKPEMGIVGFQKRAETQDASFLIDDMGYMLYGEYLENHVTTRSEVMEEITGALESAFSGRGVSMVRPNAYLYPYVNNYRDIPMVNSQYVFETDTVPFLQILLSGSTTLYSPYLNCGLYSKIDLLKLIDYGVSPSFILTGKDNYELRDSASSNLLSSSISDWEEYVVESYEFVNNVLQHTYGEEILDREILAVGLVRVDYPSGSIYVNYTEETRQAGEHELLPQSAIYVPREGGMAE